MLLSVILDLCLVWLKEETHICISIAALREGWHIQTSVTHFLRQRRVVSSLCSDLTCRKKKNEENSRLEDHLKHVNQVKQQFGYGEVGHHIDKIGGFGILPFQDALCVAIS